MDEMTWTDPQLKARYERNLKAMEQRRAAHPELLNKWAVPYKVFTRSSLHGIQNMRINWLVCVQLVVAGLVTMIFRV